ncbi:MAG: hypothetical protein M1838_005861 [Thelocarpon superellum]|nr:MAG: hypothetical protein M1838_005861 [Thelocarpon superellum]
MAPETSLTTNGPSLSFPRATFAKLSPRPFLLAHLQPSSAQTPPSRPNGRQPDTFRPPTVHTGSLTHAHGSAVVRLGDTAVVCGVQGEILLARDALQHRAIAAPSAADVQELGLLVPNIELATGCSPAHLPGQPPSVLAQSLTARLLALLHSSKVVQGEDLRIWYQPPRLSGADEDENEASASRTVKAFWTLYIDILFISLDGNAFDAAWAAAMAALTDTKLPRAFWDLDRDMVLCDGTASKATSLHLECWPFASTFSVFTDAAPSTGGEKTSTSWILADPDAFEEGLCHECVTVVVDLPGRGGEDSKPRLLKLEKKGGVSINKDGMRRITSLAAARCRQWRQAIESRSTNAS